MEESKGTSEMKTNDRDRAMKLLRSIGEVDESLVEGAAPGKSSEELKSEETEKKENRAIRIRIFSGIAAAALLLAIVLPAAMTHRRLSSEEAAGNTSTAAASAEDAAAEPASADTFSAAAPADAGSTEAEVLAGSTDAASLFPTVSEVHDVIPEVEKEEVIEEDAGLTAAYESSDGTILITLTRENAGTASKEESLSEDDRTLHFTTGSADYTLTAESDEVTGEELSEIRALITGE